MYSSNQLKQVYNFYYFKYQEILNKYNLSGEYGLQDFEHISLSDAFKFSYLANALSFINATLNNTHNTKLNALIINNIIQDITIFNMLDFGTITDKQKMLFPMHYRCIYQILNCDSDKKSYEQYKIYGYSKSDINKIFQTNIPCLLHKNQIHYTSLISKYNKEFLYGYKHISSILIKYEPYETIEYDYEYDYTFDKMLDYIISNADLNASNIIVQTKSNELNTNIKQCINNEFSLISSIYSLLNPDTIDSTMYSVKKYIKSLKSLIVDIYSDLLSNNPYAVKIKYKYIVDRMIFFYSNYTQIIRSDKLEYIHKNLKEFYDEFLTSLYYEFKFTYGGDISLTTDFLYKESCYASKGIGYLPYLDMGYYDSVQAVVNLDFIIYGHIKNNIEKARIFDNNASGRYNKLTDLENQLIESMKVKQNMLLGLTNNPKNIKTIKTNKELLEALL